MSLKAPPTQRSGASRPPRRIDRRAVIAGLGAVGVVAAGAVARQMIGDGGSPSAAGTPLPASQPLAEASPRAITRERSSPVASPNAAIAPPAARGERASPVASPTGRRTGIHFATVPEGMALVTSPRLPLFGIGPNDVTALLNGEISDWRAVGSAVAQPVEPLIVGGERMPGVEAVETYADYEALVAALADRPGGVALVPLAEIDFRVNVLSVGGVDPLRDQPDFDAATVRIAVVGDIVPGRNVHQKMVAYGDFTRPFLNVAPYLADYDLTFGNLEGNLSSTLAQPADPHSFTFVSDPAMIDGMLMAGLDAVTLANNHSVWNQEGWGVQGLLDTIDALDGAGLPYFGAGRTLSEARAPLIVTVNGIRVALLGIDGVTANYEVEPGARTGVVDTDAGANAEQAGTNPYVTDQFVDDIAAATEQAEIVIPYFHMGAEYVAIPPEWSVAGARAAIDAGATMVVTLHPHVIQGMEIYNGRPIVYSPGNFIFDQMFSVEVRSGYILDLTIRGDRVVGLRCHGVEIEDFHQPRLMSAGEQAGLMDRFWASTDRLRARGD